MSRTIEELSALADVVGSDHRSLLRSRIRASESVCAFLNSIIEECSVKDPPRFEFRSASLKRDLVSICIEFRDTATKNLDVLDAVISILKQAK